MTSYFTLVAASIAANVLLLVPISAGPIRPQNITEVCYPGMGCFNNGEPFRHLPLPQDPYNEILPTYYLFRLGNPPRTILNFDTLASEAYFVIYGWTESFEYSYPRWQKNMIDALHEAKPKADVVLVDWAKGAETLVYEQAASNTRSIGGHIAALINKNPKADVSKYHCIGFSMGGQVCGFAGKILLRRWGRISGLDPAGPSFTNLNNLASRLSTTDADFVDVMHVSTYGAMFNVGHRDYWLNGANHQPGCSWGDGSCSHQRTPHVYTATINPMSDCEFLYCSCKSMAEWTRGNCDFCDHNNGTLLGFRSNLFPKVGDGQFYGYTTDQPPFCKL